MTTSALLAVGIADMKGRRLQDSAKLEDFLKSSFKDAVL